MYAAIAPWAAFVLESDTPFSGARWVLGLQPRLAGLLLAHRAATCRSAPTISTHNPHSSAPCTRSVLDLWVKSSALTNGDFYLVDTINRRQSRWAGCFWWWVSSGCHAVPLLSSLSH